MEKRKRQLEGSYHEFFKDAFTELNKDEPLIDNWHIKDLCDILQAEMERIIARRPKTFDIIINIPPRSLKSLIVTVSLPAWSWIHKPTMKFIGSSYSGDLSVEHNMMTRQIVESEWYQAMWGDKVQISAEENTKGKFSNTEGGQRRATSTGGSITGSGGDVITVDDPTNPKKGASEVERDIANDHFDKTLSTRLNHPEIGLFIIVMQRLHEDDLTGHLLKLAKDEGKPYLHICIPAELSKHVKPETFATKYKDGLFFPSRFNPAVLNGFRISLGSMSYAGQYNQVPAQEGGALIKSAWFGRFNLHELPAHRSWNFTIDGAYTKDKTNNASVVLCYTLFNHDLYIRDVASVWKEFPELVNFIKEFCYRNGYTPRSRVYIEPKASGIPAAQSLKRHSAMNMILDKPPTVDKIVHTNASLPFIEARRCFLLADAAWVDPFLYETAMFPNAKEDGQVDCLNMAVDRANKPIGKAKFKFNHQTA